VWPLNFKFDNFDTAEVTPPLSCFSRNKKSANHVDVWPDLKFSLSWRQHETSIDFTLKRLLFTRRTLVALCSYRLLVRNTVELFEIHYRCCLVFHLFNSLIIIFLQYYCIISVSFRFCSLLNVQDIGNVILICINSIWARPLLLH